MLNLPRTNSVRCFVCCAVLLSILQSVRADILLPDGTPNPSHPTFYAWFDASDGVNGQGTPPDGASVTSWIDRTGNEHDLLRTSTNPDQQPTFREEIANGYPAVEFDGNDYLWGDSSGEFGAIAGDKTFFFVVQVHVADGGYVFDSSSGGGRNAVLTGQSASPAKWNIFTGYEPPTVGPLVDVEVFQVHSVKISSGYNEHFINGESVSSGTSQMATLKGLILGSRYTVDYFLQGELAEMLIYDELLGDLDRQAIEGYLIDKHPITEPPVIYPEYVDVFEGGDGLYPSYRIPAIITTLEGTILAFCEARQGGDHSKNDIVMRRSTDGGDTWEPLQVLHDAGGDSLNDPLVVQVREGAHAGRILLLYMRFPEGCHTNCVDIGYGPNSSHNYLMYSDDDGVTWDGPFDVTEQVRRITSNFAGTPGIGIQKRHEPHTGRIVMPLRQGPISHIQMYALFSDDGGDSWTWGDLVDDSQTPGGGDEVQMVELADGSLLLNARSRYGTKHRKIARSVDGGETWSSLEDDDELVEPQCMATVLSLADPIDGFTKSRILYAGPDSTISRIMGTVHVSYDGGETWPVSRVMYPGGYAYSCLTVIDQCNSIGCLFERDGYQYISLARYNLDWITDGDDTLADDPPCDDCPGDVDDDDAVNVVDLLILLADWGCADLPGLCIGDIVADGIVDVSDLLLLLAMWGPCQ